MAKAFVYTELQIALPFGEAPWRDLNAAIRQQPGFRNKTWLAGAGTASLGGFYAFATIEAARRFVTGPFPAEAARFGVPQTTRVFDAEVVEAASADMGSVHFGGRLASLPGAFVYTEVQLSLPFDAVPWRRMNPVLKAQPGLLAKTWLSGVHTATPGGLYAFDSIANARRFATDYFPTEAAGLGAAFTTRLFDAAPVAEASRDLASPFFI
jgi:hypothetical protein